MLRPIVVRSSSNRRGRDEKTFYDLARVSDSDGGSGRDTIVGKYCRTTFLRSLHPRLKKSSFLFDPGKKRKKRRKRVDLIQTDFDRQRETIQDISINYSLGETGDYFQ